MAEMTISRQPYIGNLYEVKYWHDDGVVFFLRNPANVLHLLNDAGLNVQAVHFVGGKRPNKTYRRPVGGRRRR